MPRSWMGAACRVLVLSILIAAAVRAVEAQVSTDIIRGRVTDGDKHPVEGADIRATSYLGHVSKSTKTDKGGRFTIIFINGEGDYWIDVRKLGLQAKRFEVRKIGDEEVMLADAQLSSAIVMLDAVDVRAQRARALPAIAARFPS